MASALHIDTDGGVDDALALVAVARSGREVASVSAVFGNTVVDQAASNARWILRLCGLHPDIYAGAGIGLARRPFQRGRPGHGLDGMNGAGGSHRRLLPPLERPHGVGVIALAARHRLQGLFLGPLTNLARALLEDPKAFQGWAPVVMAGAFAVEGMGDGGADFNTWSDPEAMERALDAGVAPRLVPLDVTSQVLLERALFRAAADAPDAVLARQLWRAVEPYIDQHMAIWGGDGCRPHDAVAAGAMLWPELYDFEPARLEMDADRPGRLRRADGPANAEVCVRLDAAGVAAKLREALFS